MYDRGNVKRVNNTIPCKLLRLITAAFSHCGHDNSAAFANESYICMCAQTKCRMEYANTKSKYGPAEIHLIVLQNIDFAYT